MKVSALSANSALRSSEFIVGVIMSLYAAKVLLPPSTGVIRGLVSGLSNARMLLPSEGMLGRGQLFVCLITLPLVSPSPPLPPSPPPTSNSFFACPAQFAAFLASVQQAAGSHLLAPAILMLLLADMIIMANQKTLTSPFSTVEDLKKGESRTGMCQSALVAGAAAILYLYLSRSNVKIMEYVRVARERSERKDGVGGPAS